VSGFGLWAKRQVNILSLEQTPRQTQSICQNMETALGQTLRKKKKVDS